MNPIKWIEEQRRINEELRANIAAEAQRQAACKHDGRFTFLGGNSIGYGTCNDCGAQIGQDDILNMYIKKMDKILDAHNIR